MKKVQLTFTLFVIIMFLQAFSFLKTEPQSIIKFKIYTDTICSKTDYERVVLFGKNFIKNDSIIKNSYIEIRNYTCDFELKNNPLIGFKRAKKIYDILEKESNVPRAKIHYIDLPSREGLQINGKIDCENMLKSKSVGVKLEIHP